MPGTNKAEHVTLQVEDVAEAATFYENVLGFAEITRQNGTVYYGCGLDENYDLAIREGDPGVEHVAVRIEDDGALEKYEDRVAAEGVNFERTDGLEPGQENGLRIELPSQLPLELVTVADKEYRHSDTAAVEGRGGIAPLDLNHYNYMSPFVKEDAQFMRDVLDFSVSDVVLDDWSGGAFLRKGDTHHDIALLQLPGTPENHAAHHHTAFTVRSVDHMVQLIDRIRQAGLYLELGIGRHYAGDNLYCYFKTPDGHRIELTSQMAELDADSPTTFVDSPEEATSAWQETLDMPESFLHGSGLSKSTLHKRSA